MAYTLLKDVAEGSIVKIEESAGLREYYVACHNYESDLNGEGRTLLVRKESYLTTAQKWHTSNVNSYDSSYIDTYLNDTYFLVLSEQLQGKIKPTTFYYTSKVDNTVKTLTRKAFLLSVTELGFTNTSANVEGSVLPTADILRIMYKEVGTTSKADYYTRTPYNTSNTSYVFYVKSDGTLDKQAASTGELVRPCFTIDANTTVVLNDGVLSFDVPVLKEGFDLGNRGKDFFIDYTVSSEAGILHDVSITEMLNDTIVRTYNSVIDTPQQMIVPTTGLELGQHTVTILADIDGVQNSIAYTFTMSPIWINHGYNNNVDFGNKIDSFSVFYNPETVDGTDIIITEYLDGKELRSYTSANLAEQSMRIMMKDVPDGRHNISIAAQIGEEIATADFYFNVPALILHDSGTIQELQDENGEAIFPATLARAVFSTNGINLEEELNNFKEYIKTDSVKIEVGSYKGTGTFGSSNKNSLSFSFTPMVVFFQMKAPVEVVNETNTSQKYYHRVYSIPYIWGSDKIITHYWQVSGTNDTYNSDGHDGSGTCTATANSKTNTLTWYVNTSNTNDFYSYIQLNKGTVTYVAIGR